MKTPISLPCLLAMSSITIASPAAPNGQPETFNGAATLALNSLGISLLTKATPPEANALLSPYSIQSALAMTYAGAAGETQEEMQRVLHYSASEEELHGSMAALKTRLDSMVQASLKRAEEHRRPGITSDPLTLTVANRLFGQRGYEFREPFLNLARDTYGAPLQLLNFKTEWESGRKEINSWVEEQTRQRIRDLIPADGLNKFTRLVLVNAIYLKAPWTEEFPAHATKPEPFHVKGGEAVPVPTMNQTDRLGFRREAGYTVVTIPYSGGDLQFVILLPDAADGLPALEANLTAGVLASLAKPASAEVILHLPKFKLEPPMMRLGDALQALGMKTAFDKPQGSANFDRMAPRKPDDYLFLSEVFHKTFLSLDEKGTEAAAATAVVMMRPTSIAVDPPKPIEVKVDRPFLFAIQQRSTGACLFLGRLVDPR